MNEERWRHIADLFADLVELPGSAQRDYLENNCSDAEVRKELTAMLAAHEGAGLRLENRLVSDDDAIGARGLSTGTRLGPYRIEALVGRGGMGEVYRAERADGEFEQVVAIKLLRPDAGTVELMRRFRAERNLLARLSHPNIASILDSGTSPDGRPFVVLRFVEGQPITAYASQLPLDHRIRLFVKVARAVQFAHNRLIVHRDIKPSNILVSADGEPVLLDFGIAKLLDASDPEETTTRTGQRLLSLSHAAPEQLRGESITTATDVYGLGALLFELLTGDRLFASLASTPGELERAILEVDAPPPSSRMAVKAEAHALRGDIDRIVQMALRKEPERRYQSADQLANDLERHLAGLPVSAQPDRWRYRTGKFLKRNRAVLSGTVALVVVAGLLAVREVRQSQRIADERDKAVREQAAGESVLEFMTSLFQQSDPRVVPGGDTLRVADFLGLAERQLKSLAGQPERQMRVYRTLGNVRFSRGDYAVAESLVTIARDLGVKQFGPDHAEVLRTEALLGDVFLRRRGITAARPVFERVLNGLRHALGPDHPDVAAAYMNLAVASEAPETIRALLDSGIAIRTKIGRSDSVELAALLDAQARERGVRGRFQEAIALDEASLRILEAKLPKDHVYRLTVMGNMATWLGGLGRWELALPIAEEVLAVARRQSTKSGEGFAIANERVALIQANIPERRNEAEQSIREALRIFRATVAPEHDLITSSMRNLAIVIASQGRDAEGLTLLDSAVARDSVRGNKDAAAYLMGQRVPMLIRLGRVRDAAQNAGRAGELRSRLPVGSTRGADLSYWLGLVALAESRDADAARHLGSASEAIASIYPETHPRRAIVQCALGIALSRQERPDEARGLLARDCPRIEQWGLRDPTISGWARIEAARLNVQLSARASR